MVTVGVGRIDLVIVGGTGGQTRKRHLMARNHRRINWRTCSVSSGGSVIDRGVGGDVCCPNDLPASGFDPSAFFLPDDQPRRRGRVPIFPANQALTTRKTEN